MRGIAPEGRVEQTPATGEVAVPVQDRAEQRRRFGGSPSVAISLEQRRRLAQAAGLREQARVLEPHAFVFRMTRQRGGIRGFCFRNVLQPVQGLRPQPRGLRIAGLLPKMCLEQRNGLAEPAIVAQSTGLGDRVLGQAGERRRRRCEEQKNQEMEAQVAPIIAAVTPAATVRAASC